MRRRSKLFAFTAGALALAYVGSRAVRSAPAEALSYGTGGCGKLDGGVALRCTGDNFESGAALSCWLGRNYLHPLVAATVVDAYAALKASHRERAVRWQYGETGYEHGGRFRPHRTHQNGLAADFFMPLQTADGSAASMPISIWNKMGYGNEFDAQGKMGEWRIDEALIADHLLALASAGAAHQVRIERIIVTPDFHAKLFAGRPDLKVLLPLFMKQEAWVRHDEHYHVDFAIPEPLRRPLRCS